MVDLNRAPSNGLRPLRPRRGLLQQPLRLRTVGADPQLTQLPLR